MNLEAIRFNPPPTVRVFRTIFKCSAGKLVDWLTGSLPGHYGVKGTRRKGAGLFGEPADDDHVTS